MKSGRQAVRALGIAVIVLGIAVSAWAQTTNTGTFTSLSPGEQKIARALFEAQSTSGSTKPLTLDEIAAMKQGHKGWGEVFKKMKADGLLTEKNLGQVVSRFERHHPELAAKRDNHAKPEKLEKTDKPDRPERMEKPERPERPERPGR